MARYNLSRYNLAHYNRSAASDVTYDSMKIAALFNAYIGLGQTIKDNLMAQSTMTAKSNIAAGTIKANQFDASFISDIKQTYFVCGHNTLSGQFENEIESAAIVKDNTPQAAEFLCEAFLGPRVKDEIAGASEFGCTSNLGNKILDPDGIEAYAIFGATISAEVLDETILDLSCTIPPDGILVIDSDNFRVLLNGANAIKYHSGNWIDELSRQSKVIKIEGGANSLEASIYFQELWL